MSGVPPLRNGVVGLGRAFTLMLPTFDGDARVERVAVCDPRQAARARFARAFARPVYAEVAALVADPAVEPVTPAPLHQHFGPVIVCCAHAEVRPLPDAVWVYSDAARERHALERPAVPRFEVVDELVGAVRHRHPPLHDGAWGRTTLQICLAMLASARGQRDVELA